MATIDPSREQALKRLDQLAELLDNRFRIPGTRFRFGIDSLLGLVPYLGDIFTFVMSGILIVVMGRHGASGKLAFKMMGNIWLDALVGTIPIIGDLFDFQYKANLRNVQLLREHYEEGRHSGSAWGIIIMIVVSLILLIILSLIIMWKIVAWIFG